MDVKVNATQSVQTSDAVSKNQDSTSKDFKFTLLSKVQEQDLQDKLNQMMDGITTQGKQLADHMDISDMKQYRQSIKDFMNEIVSRSHEFSRENFLDRRGRHRVYGIIRKVDDTLDSLAQELISDEKDHLSILGKVDEIRGMLLDLMV